MGQSSTKGVDYSNLVNEYPSQFSQSFLKMLTRKATPSTADSSPKGLEEEEDAASSDFLQCIESQNSEDEQEESTEQFAEMDFEFRIPAGIRSSQEINLEVEESSKSELVCMRPSSEKEIDPQGQQLTGEQKRIVLNRIVDLISAAIRENEGEASRVPNKRQESKGDVISTCGAIVVGDSYSTCNKVEIAVKSQLLLFYRKLPISFNVLVAALIYLDRMQKRARILAANSNAFVVAAVILAIKMWQDSPLWLQEAVKFTVYTLPDLHNIEHTAYALLDCKLFISEEEFSIYLTSLCSF